MGAKKKLTFHGISPNLNNKSQKEAWQVAPYCDLLYLVGPPGCGKTFLASALAINALAQEAIERIYIIRPAVPAAGEDLGYLPGDIGGKLAPFLLPVREELKKLCIIHDIPYAQVPIESLTIAHLRGRNLDNALVIVDEAQNMTREQFRLLFGRMCKHCKMVVTGDPEQADIPNSYLIHAISRTKHLPGVGLVEFDERANERHGLVPLLMGALT